jgi:hypothetical protein
MMERVRINKKKLKGRGKGPKYERAMCQRLSLWVSRMRREDVFWRSATSGGRATLKSRKLRGTAPLRVRDKRGKVLRIKFDAHCGDIVSTHAVGGLLTDLFVLECKHYADLDIESLFFKGKGCVPKFWEKVKDAEAHPNGKEPLMVMRQNNQPDVVCTTKAGRDALGLSSSLAIAHFPRIGMWVYLLRDLITECDFDVVRRAHQHPEVIKALFKE